jgi:hypothetical protein
MFLLQAAVAVVGTAAVAVVLADTLQVLLL